MYFLMEKSGVSHIRGDMAALINEIIKDLSSSSSHSTLLRVALIIMSKTSTAFKTAGQKKQQRKKGTKCQLQRFYKEGC